MDDIQESFLKGKSLYEEAIKRHVCSKCIDFGEDGICHTQDPKGCAIFRFLPELVAISEHLHEPTMESYVQAVREEICTKCRAQTLEGVCELRDKLDCGLDRYLDLVFEAIDEANALRKQEKKKYGS